jgi:hypothetical protein
MSDAIRQQLPIVVERAVRPVRATLAYKLRIRGELLQHVTGAFEQELAGGLDERAALIAVGERFGDPGDLAVQLERARPRKDAALWRLERWIEPRPREALWHRAARYGLATFALHAVALVGFIVVFHLCTQRLDSVAIYVRLLTLWSLGTGLIFFTLTFLTEGLRQALFGTSPRWLSRVLPLCLFSCGIPVAFLVGLQWLLSGELAPNWTGIRPSLPFVPLFPATLLVVAKLTQAERQSAAEWETLELD